MSTLIDLVGKHFGRLTVLKYAESRKGHAKWQCKCSCGKLTIVSGSNLCSGHTKSCGCFLLDKVSTHKMHRTKAYRTWSSMKQRCLNKNRKCYNNYGGRGITVCDEWLNSFEAFYKEVGPPPENNHNCSIHRIDNDKNYMPGNVKWAFSKEQNANKRDCYHHILTFQGRTMNLTQWSEELNIKYSILKQRLRRGWSVENTLSLKKLTSWDSSKKSPYLQPT